MYLVSEVFVPSQKKWSCICVYVVSILPLSTNCCSIFVFYSVIYCYIEIRITISTNSLKDWGWTWTSCRKSEIIS